MSCNAKKDSNGTWRIQYRWTDWTGTKKRSQKRGFKTKKEAEEWYAHFMLQQSSDPTMTLADFWEIYKADMEKRLRKTTMKQKEYVSGLLDKMKQFISNRGLGEGGIKYVYRTKTGGFTDWNYIAAVSIDKVMDSSGSGDWLTAIFLYLLLRKYPNYTACLSGQYIEQSLIEAQRYAT